MSGHLLRSVGEEEPPVLATLPHDMCRLILIQSSITAWELASLEATSKTLRLLIDDEAWHHAFLQRHRVRVLKEPGFWYEQTREENALEGCPGSSPRGVSSPAEPTTDRRAVQLSAANVSPWKQELRHREIWSHDWDNGSHEWLQLVRHRNSKMRRHFSLSPTTHRKLSSLATKVLHSFGSAKRPNYRSGPHPQQQHATHAVDPSGHIPGSVATIGAALARAKPHDVVLVEPGEYREQLTLKCHVQVLGHGPPGSVVVVGVDGPTIQASGKTISRVCNLRIRQEARTTHDDGSMSGAVLITNGAVVLVEESEISSDDGHCVVVQGASSYGYILHNIITNARGVGVLVCDDSHGVIEDNDIYHNDRAGVAILTGGDPLVCHNRIHVGMDSGVLVSDGGRGRVEDNDICGNRRAGVAIFKGGAPQIKRNLIHDGYDSGVLVCDGGTGLVADNLIFANQVMGVCIGRRGFPRVTGNTIRDGIGAPSPNDFSV